MKLKNLGLGALTTVITTLGAPNAYAQGNSSSQQQSSDSIRTEYLQKEQALYTVIENRFKGINVKNATFEASQTMSEATSMLLLNDSLFNEYMELAHDFFEEKEIHAERIKAYTVQKGDNEKLAAMKTDAKKTYDDCLKILKKLNESYKELKKYIKEHPEVLPQANDSVASEDPYEDFMKSNKNPLNADKKLLELQMKYANRMEDLVQKQEELVKKDVPLRIAQLNQDIFNKKAAIAKLNIDIKEWDNIQKEIDIYQSELDALKLGEFDNEAKSKLSQNQQENSNISNKNLTTAQQNWQNFLEAQGLDDKINNLKKGQLELGESRDTLVSQLNELKIEIQEDKAELKVLRKSRGNAEIASFTKDEYEGSTLQLTASDFAEAYKKNKEASRAAVNNVAVNEYQAKIAQYRKNAEDVKTEELPNGTSQTTFTFNNKGKKTTVSTVEYPNGKSVIFDENNNIVSYDKNGNRVETYKYKDNAYTDSKNNVRTVPEILMTAGSGNLR